MTAELVETGGGEIAVAVDLPPLILDLTRAWLWSFDSVNTRQAYERNIRRWFDFCAETGLDPLEARKPHGDVFARWYAENAPRPPAPKTVAQLLAAVSSWYEYLHETDAIDANRFKKVKRPKIPRKHSETVALTKSEAQDVLREADRDHGREQLRTSAVIRVLLQVGLRVSEVVDAQIEDLGFARGYRTLRVMAKGAKPLVRRLPVETVYALDLYLAERARREGVEMKDLTGPIFVTGPGRPWPRTKAWEMVRRIAKQAGIQSKVGPHTLRHTYASLALDGGASPRQVQLDLNHEDLATTEIYWQARDRLEKDTSQLVASQLE
ncbi:site-specific tyrosine recombinase XerD [Planotetraspora phitsanulokensis]|uniref:Tyrosine recombinase XerC n=1 Tax=Planotetraspora phitsanulokensis TaxID=575192 RepID=A0A8J3UED0_9ACTN|nr:tyrosine-type recombinase/integrase [Planotetraspora phitsanulokensis]GII42956.1 tyrosine recombinase XerC [Planotetraspora phitsanulokensis]